MKWSVSYIPTLRDAPQEAEVISHQLMLRAGLIRRLSSGIYSLMPLGLKALSRLTSIIREEMNQAGAQEISLPFVQPKEIWEESGRWQKYGKELARFTDRHENEFCLQPTSEEAVVDLVKRDLNSYRQLPINLYQIQTKFRDEIRPRFGVMRGREFLMKDAYSFDVDETSARESYKKMRRAYHRIFTRTGLDFRSVEADTGAIGGNDSEEFMVLASSGEDEIISCTKCDYAANQEKAVSRLAQAKAETQVGSQDSAALEKIATPGIKTIENLAQSLSLSPHQLLKTMVATNSAEDRIFVFLLGHHELNLVKLGASLSRAGKADGLRLAREDELAAWNLPKGSLGPVKLQDRSKYFFVLDDAVDQKKAFLSGANEDGFHFKNVNLSRDSKIDWIDCVRTVQAGESCVRCGADLQSSRGIEVGHVFYLGTKYSSAMQLKVRLESGEEPPVEMGCYGIGVGRTLAACIEQNHDQWGIRWPLSLAPYPVGIVSLDEGAVAEAAETTYEALTKKGLDCLWDDRNLSAGVKLKDMDLIGTPYQIVYGKRSFAEGKCEVKIRQSNEKTLVPLEQAVDYLVGLLQKETEQVNARLKEAGS